MIFIETFKRNVKQKWVLNKKSKMLFDDNDISLISIFDVCEKEIRLFLNKPDGLYSWHKDHICPKDYFDKLKKINSKNKVVMNRDKFKNYQALHSSVNTSKTNKVFIEQIDYIKKEVLLEDEEAIKFFENYMRKEGTLSFKDYR